jgi:hypothetical protein
MMSDEEPEYVIENEPNRKLCEVFFIGSDGSKEWI